MKELLVASGNLGKVAEIARALEGCPFRLLSLADFPSLPAVVEDGDTFEANARKKAMSAALATGIPALADDSGLVVDALGGLPGVYSARFAGECAGDRQNNDKLLFALNNTPGADRTASFVCVMVLCFPDGKCAVFEGELKGKLLDEPRGSGGFGYDPLFLVPEYGKTLAELDIDVKNSISHRGKALARARDYLLRGLNNNALII
jgi:XTP/dITP diphosphohydrolase